MNYIENKHKFEQKYASINIDLILSNYVSMDYEISNYRSYLINMKYYSKEDSVKLCQSFFESRFEKDAYELLKVMNNSNILFLKENDDRIIKNNIIDGKTVYNNGIIESIIVEKNNLYDLFILVHEITHIISLNGNKKEEFKEESNLFSEVSPFCMEDILIEYLSTFEEFRDDLNKCIKARNTILKNIMRHLLSVKNSLDEDVDFEFRYLVAILFKDKLKKPFYESFCKIGNCDIKEILYLN